jgi:hypothetical protein
VVPNILKISLLGIFVILLSFSSIPDIPAYGQLLEQQQQQSVKILSSSDYQDDAGYFHIIGEVGNDSPDAQEFIKVTASLYDSANRIVETAFAFSDVDVLRPSEKSPFDIILDDNEQASKASSYKLSVSSDSSDPKQSLLKLTVGDNYYDDLGYAHVLGEVTNQGAEVTNFAKISGTFYNDQNKVVGTGFTFTEPSDLAPGQSAPFDLLLTEHASPDRFGEMSSGSLNVQSQQFAMVLPASIFRMDGDIRSSSSSGNSDSDDDNDDGSSSSNNRLGIEIDVSKNPIVRGNTQSFTIKVSDRNAGGPVQGAQVEASVKYAGPHTERFDSQITDNSGSLTFSWPIGGNSNPGIFTITADVSKDGYGSTTEKASFEVITKADEIPLTLQSNELICDDGIDNDNDGLIDIEDSDCSLSVDPCIENPELPDCPPPINPCEENPELPECLLPPPDPCEIDPEAEGCEPSPDPCEVNPDSPGCNFEEPGPGPGPGDEDDDNEDGDESSDEGDESGEGEEDSGEENEDGDSNDSGGGD